jgi:hypothetical protein
MKASRLWVGGTASQLWGLGTAAKLPRATIAPLNAAAEPIRNLRRRNLASSPAFGRRAGPRQGYTSRILNDC